MLLERLEEPGSEEALGSVIGAKAEAVKAVTAWKGQVNNTDAFPDSEKQQRIGEEKKSPAEGGAGIANFTPWLL